MLTIVDGHANQPEYLLEMIRRNSERARLFTFGVGPTPSRFQIKLLTIFFLYLPILSKDIL